MLTLAIMTVRSMRRRPLLGSSSSGKWATTSAISFPRSPHPISMMTSASDHLAICWSVTVLPVPKPPGMAAAPPFAHGKNVSMTLWPVISGCSRGSLSFVGRPILTGQVCIIFRGTTPSAVSSSPTTSSTVKSPDFIDFIVPDWSGGTITLCSKDSVSCTVPMMSPPTTFSPALTFASKGQTFSLLRGSMLVPLDTKGPVRFQSSVSDRCTPSTMVLMMPGPNSATRGCPVSTTGSPGRRPLVTS